MTSTLLLRAARRTFIAGTAALLVGTVAQQAFGKMRPEETRAAGHDNAGRRPGHRTGIGTAVRFAAGSGALTGLGLRVGRPTPM